MLSNVGALFLVVFYPLIKIAFIGLIRCDFEDDIDQIFIIVRKRDAI